MPATGAPQPRSAPPTGPSGPPDLDTSLQTWLRQQALRFLRSRRQFRAPAVRERRDRTAGRPRTLTMRRGSALAIAGVEGRGASGRLAAGGGEKEWAFVSRLPGAYPREPPITNECDALDTQARFAFQVVTTASTWQWSMIFSLRAIPAGPGRGAISSGGACNRLGPTPVESIGQSTACSSARECTSGPPRCCPRPRRDQS